MPTPVSTPASREVVDPVCGMTIDPADAAGHADYKGTTYYFCAESCLEKFKADPEQYVQGSGIRDQGSKALDRRSPVPDPGPRYCSGSALNFSRQLSAQK